MDDLRHHNHPQKLGFIKRIENQGLKEKLIKEDDTWDTPKSGVLHYYRDIGCPVVHVTLWNQAASNFDAGTYNSLEKPVMVAAIACWVRKYHEQPQLSGTSIVHYYLALTHMSKSTIGR
ncbi:uncharacterized protein [Rutidosis leptorrhynchoides]|uniref:uncharacterized protein n=1 Tax=Rutidosis leptorrhynchoides TaxID=125765 RepID=UPI003A9937AD